MPILWALATAKIGERELLAAMLEIDADLVADRGKILLVSDKGFSSAPFERELAGLGIDLLRPSRKREKQRHGEPMLKKVRQLSTAALFPTLRPSSAPTAGRWSSVLPAFGMPDGT